MIEDKKKDLDNITSHFLDVVKVNIDNKLSSLVAYSKQLQEKNLFHLLDSRLTVKAGQAVLPGKYQIGDLIMRGPSAVAYYNCENNAHVMIRLEPVKRMRHEFEHHMRTQQALSLEAVPASSFVAQVLQFGEARLQRFVH